MLIVQRKAMPGKNMLLMSFHITLGMGTLLACLAAAGSPRAPAKRHPGHRPWDERVIANRAAKDSDAIAALRFVSPRGPHWLTAKFLAKIINNKKYTPLRRAACMVALVRVFVRPPLTMQQFASLLGNPTWGEPAKAWVHPAADDAVSPIDAPNLACGFRMPEGHGNWLEVWFGLQPGRSMPKNRNIGTALAGGGPKYLHHRRIRQIVLIRYNKWRGSRTIFERLSHGQRQRERREPFPP